MAIYRGPGGSGDATTDASSEATVATEKAAEAAASAVAAANSATLAEASYDSFDDRYLGPKGSAPSVDNDGNSLLTGALYFNSSTNNLYVWNGSAWEQAALTLTSANIVAALGYTPVPNTRTLTINGTAYDLSTNRVWTITGDSLLPSQSGNSGKVLTTNGTTTSWATDATGVASFNSRTGAVTLSSADVIAALATGSIATVKLADSSVTTAKINADAVTNAKIADDAVDTENIADDAITAALVDDGAIVTAGLATNSVTTAKITDSNVTTAKIAGDAITNAKIADDAVDTENIADDAITSALIDDNAVVTAGIADDAVTEAKLANAINTAIAANTAKTGITTGQADAITANTAKVTNATHSGEVTGATALTIADNVVDEANLKVSNAPTNGYFLSAQSGDTGGLTWAATSAGSTFASDITVNGLTVGKGNGSVATSTSLGVTALQDITGANNTAIGHEAMKEATSASSSVAVGSGAMGVAIATGTANTAVGYTTGQAITSGASNTLVGHKAGLALDTGASNVMIGNEAGDEQTGSLHNTVIGAEAGQKHTSGYSVMIGSQAGKNATSANELIAIGRTAGGSGTMTGNQNICIGKNAGAQLTTGHSSNIIGNNTGDAITEGVANNVYGTASLPGATTPDGTSCFGGAALNNLTTGNANDAFGQNALYGVTIGYDNVGIGTATGTAITEGFRNTAVGHESGQVLTTGSNNTFLGYGATPSSATVSNEITLGNSSVTKVRMGNGDPIYDTGSILQVVTNTPDTGVVNKTNTAWGNLDGDLETAITPKNASSTLILEVVFTFGGNNNTGISYQKFYDITNSADINLSAAGSRTSCHACVRNQDYDANDCVMVTMMTTVSAGSTTARTYGIYNRCENTTQASYFGNPSNTSALGYAKPTFKITEVLA